MIKSTTIYQGNEGEEKAERTFNYNFAGSTVKTTTLFTYVNDTLDESVTYRGDITGVPVPADVKKSVTTYIGNEGEEKAEYTYNFNYLGTQIKTVTEFTYVSDTLTQSDT